MQALCSVKPESDACRGHVAWLTGTAHAFTCECALTSLFTDVVRAHHEFLWRKPSNICGQGTGGRGAQTRPGQPRAPQSELAASLRAGEMRLGTQTCGTDKRVHDMYMRRMQL